MKFGLVIIGVIMAINALLFILSLIDRIRLRRQVRQQWGQTKPTSRFDSETSLAESFELSRAFQEKDSEVDLWTWEDLAGYQVFEKINHTYSSIGAEVLYERLRRFHFSDTESQQLEQDIAFFEEHPAEREACELVCASLGKQANNFVLHYLQQTDGKQLGSLRLFIRERKSFFFV